MKGHELKRGANRFLLRQFPGTAFESRLFHVAPIGALLRGVYFDASGFSRDGCYLVPFVLPSAVPWEHLSFNFHVTNRRPWVTFTSWDDESGWDQVADFIHDGVWELLKAIEGPAAFIEFGELEDQSRNPPNALAMAVASAQCQRWAETRHWLDAVDRGLMGIHPDVASHYRPSSVDLRRAIDDPATVAGLLGEWRSRFLASCHLPIM